MKTNSSPWLGHYSTFRLQGERNFCSLMAVPPSFCGLGSSWGHHFWEFPKENFYYYSLFFIFFINVKCQRQTCFFSSNPAFGDIVVISVCQLKRPFTTFNDTEVVLCGLKAPSKFLHLTADPFPLYDFLLTSPCCFKSMYRPKVILSIFILMYGLPSLVLSYCFVQVQKRY